MEISFLMKVAGVGFLSSVLCLVLNRTGREEQAIAVSIAGLVVVGLMLLTQLSTMIGSFRNVFGF